MSGERNSALSECVARLACEPQWPPLLARLQAQRGDLARRWGEQVHARIPALRDGRHPDPGGASIPRLRAHLDDLVRVLGGGAPGDFEPVAEEARTQAEQRFPLEAGLQVYRCGHTLLVQWSRAAGADLPGNAPQVQRLTADLGDACGEYMDAICSVAIDAYLSHTRVLAAVAGDQRAQLLALLVNGVDETDRHAAGILREGGYLSQPLRFCVAVARPVDPSEMLNSARARRLADSIEHTLKRSPTRHLIDIRHNLVVIVFSERARLSGWSAPARGLAERVAETLMLVGNAVVIGISNDVLALPQIQAAYAEARLAVECADPGHRVVPIAAIPLRALLLQAGGDQVRRVLPGWAHELQRADAKVSGSLVETLRAYADANMNVLQAARRLGVHPNTLYARMQRIADITGHDARGYHALTQLLLLCDCMHPVRAPAPGADPKKR